MTAESQSCRAGEACDGWRRIAVQEVSDKVTVGFVGSMAHLFRRSGVPLLRGQNVTPRGLALTELRYIDSSTHRLWSKSALQAGDVVLVRVGYPGTAAVIPENLGNANAASLVVVRPNRQRVAAEFLVAVFNSPQGQRQVTALLVGGAQQVLNTSTASAFEVLLPPIDEQRAIAAALADADGLIESLERLIAKKRQIKLGAMQELLTGKRRLPGFEGKWQTTAFGSIGRCIRGVSFDPDAHLHPVPTSTTIALLRAQNVQNGNLNLDDVLHVSDSRVSDSQLLQCGDVVVCMANGSKALVGKAAVYERRSESILTVGAFMAIFRPEPDSGSKQLMPYLFHSHAFRAHIDVLLAGSSISNLTPDSVESCSVVLPVDKDEQHAIAAVLSDMDAEITTLESRLTKARQIKQGMMQQLLTGKIRLPTKDAVPDEVPA